MKLPPVLVEKVAPADTVARSDRDRGFLIFASVVLVALGLGFKSELLGAGQVWALALGLVVISATAVAVFGAGFMIAARLDYLRLLEQEKRGHLVLQEIMLVVAVFGAYLVVV